MSRKNLAILLGVLVIIVVVIVVVLQNHSSSSASPSMPTQTTTTVGTTGSYTMAQVATHNSATSCWTTINGNVYDVTTWINQHPGGKQAILSLCGVDGTAAFNGQHGGQSRPESELAAFKIGTLAQ